MTLPNPRYTKSSYPKTHAAIVEALKQKITSFEQWNALMLAAGVDRVYLETQDRTLTARGFEVPHWRGRDYGDTSGTPHGAGTMGQAPINERWWLEREFARMIYGVYPERPDFLGWIEGSFKLAAYALHPSKEDPMMVAYTASREDGMRDKQVRTTLGKFLRKHFHLLTDAHIQSLEQAYRAEMDPTFFVATTPEEIEWVYTKMDGDSGCMRYTVKGHWYKYDMKVHPSIVYAAPGLGVAYLKRGDVPVARAVVYQNPDNPDDKRYVRLYGAAVLKRKLERAGYKLDNLAGAHLRFEPHKEPGWHIMPYLDGPGGARDGRTATYGVVVDHGAEKGRTVLVLTEDQATSMQKLLGVSPRHYQSTEGRQPYAEVKVEQLTQDDALTGEKINLFSGRVEQVFVNGKLGLTSTTELAKLLTANPEAMTQLSVWAEDRGTWRDVWADATTPVFEIGGRRIIDTDDNRERAGFRKLSAKFGYDPSVWHASGLVCFVSSDGASHAILREDRRRIIEAAGNDRIVHVSEYNAAKRSGQYETLSPVGTVRTIAHVDNPIITMPNGKKVLPGFHAVTQLWDGTWEYDTYVMSMRVAGCSVAYSSREGAQSAQLAQLRVPDKLLDEYAEAAVRRVFAYYEPRDAEKMSSVVFRDYLVHAGRSDRTMVWDDAAQTVRIKTGYSLRSMNNSDNAAVALGQLESMARAAEYIASATDEQLEHVGSVIDARLFGRHFPLLKERLFALLKERLDREYNVIQQMTEIEYAIENEVDASIAAVLDQPFVAAA